MKMLYGIPAMHIAKHCNEKGHIEDLLLDEDMEDPWCDFAVYETDNGKYYAEFETFLGFKDKDGCRNWIIECLNSLTTYMECRKIDTTKELNMYQVFTLGVNVNTEFDTLEELYAYLKLMVFGFHGQGLFAEECGTYE